MTGYYLVRGVCCSNGASDAQFFSYSHYACDSTNFQIIQNCLEY